MTHLLQDFDENMSMTRADHTQSPDWVVMVRTVLTLRFLSVVLFRLSQNAGRTSGFAGGILKQINHLVTGADLAWQANVGPGLVLPHPTAVVVGPFCEIGARCRLQSSVTIGGSGVPGEGAASPTLGIGVTVGAGGRVLGAVRIGDNSVVGANSVVTTSMPSNSFIVGIPAAVKALRDEGHGRVDDVR